MTINSKRFKHLCRTHLLWAIALFTSLISAADAAVTLESLDGTLVPWDSLKDKWVFINYWASWCEPCVHEIREFNRFYSKNQQKKVALFAVNYEGLTLAEQQRLAQQYHIHYPSLKQSSVKALHLQSTEVVPVTYVFDPQGHLSDTLYGGQTQHTLQDLIKAYEKNKTLG